MKELFCALVLALWAVITIACIGWLIGYEYGKKKGMEAMRRGRKDRA